MVTKNKVGREEHTNSASGILGYKDIYYIPVARPST
jgi:hypothetical protein